MRNRARESRYRYEWMYFVRINKFISLCHCCRGLVFLFVSFSEALFCFFKKLLVSRAFVMREVREERLSRTGWNREKWFHSFSLFYTYNDNDNDDNTIIRSNTDRKHKSLSLSLLLRYTIIITNKKNRRVRRKSNPARRRFTRRMTSRSRWNQSPRRKRRTKRNFASPSLLVLFWSS